MNVERVQKVAIKWHGKPWAVESDSPLSKYGLAAAERYTYPIEQFLCSWGGDLYIWRYVLCGSCGAMIDQDEAPDCAGHRKNCEWVRDEKKYKEGLKCTSTK